MFDDIADYFQSIVSPVDFRPSHVISNDIWMEKHGLSKKEYPNWLRLNNTLSDNQLLIRVLKQIYKQGSITLEEWENYLESVLSLPESLKKEKLGNLSLSDIEAWETDVLQAMFIAYRVIVWNEEFSKHLSKKDKENHTLLNFLNNDKPNWKPENTITDKDICWNMVSWLTLEYDKWFSYRIIVLEDIGVIETRVTASDLFTALFYQLLMHIKAGEAGLQGASIGFCEHCGQEFLRTTVRKRFCDSCGSISERVARSRSRKKERESNGNY